MDETISCPHPPVTCVESKSSQKFRASPSSSAPPHSPLTVPSQRAVLLPFAQSFLSPALCSEVSSSQGSFLSILLKCQCPPDTLCPSSLLVYELEKKYSLTCLQDVQGYLPRVSGLTSPTPWLLKWPQVFTWKIPLGCVQVWPQTLQATKSSSHGYCHEFPSL